MAPGARVPGRAMLFHVGLLRRKNLFYSIPPILTLFHSSCDRLERMAPGARVLTRESQFLGWPCGARLQLPGVVFLKWVLPVARATPAIGEIESPRGDDSPAVSAADSAAGSDAASDDLEAREIEHLLDCAAEDAVDADGGAGERAET